MGQRILEGHQLARLFALRASELVGDTVLPRMTLVEKFMVVALASPIVARPPAETGTQIDTQALAAQDTVVGGGSIEAGGGVAAGLSSSLPSLSRTQRPRRAARDAQFCVAQS